MNIEKPIRDPLSPAAGDDALLAGLIIDASGRPMELKLAGSRTAGPRCYVSAPSPAPQERIAAARIERNIVMLLQGLHLLGQSWRPRDVLAVLRRVVVYPDALVFQLDRRTCVGIWRAQGRLSARSSGPDVLRAIAAWVPSGIEVSDVGWMLCLSTPRRTRPRRARTRRVTPAEIRP